MYTETLLQDPKQFIIIKGAKAHNLKNVSLAIPRNKLVVVTGVSGSGKSSLTIDTLYAEGQRRYVESLSSYARQFLMRMDKPNVDYIKGISPAIAIEQKVVTRNSRSTVGTLTEIYDYLRLLFARIGKTYSPISGNQVKRHDVTDVVNYIFSFPSKTRVQIFIPLLLQDTQSVTNQLSLLLQKGYTRLAIGNELVNLEDLLTDDTKHKNLEEAKILIDRLIIRSDNEEVKNRCADSVNTAFFESGGDCIIEIVGKEFKQFSNRFELDGLTFEQPNPHFFNFNSPYGACKKCEGFGYVLGIDENLVIPDKTKSIYDNAIACWRGEKMKTWKNNLIHASTKFDFPIHRAIQELTAKQYELLWAGNKYFQGINEFFKHLESQQHKIQYRILLAKYRGKTVCPDCKSSRLRIDAQYVKITGKNILDLVFLPIQELKVFFDQLDLSTYEEKVARRILTEIKTRLKVMVEVGLGYLTLSRLSNTLSGGETQRINLTRSLGSNLTNSMYILDEPSIGLHSRDTERLIKVLRMLRDLGNTVIIVEHDEDVIRAADYLIDMGPLAGQYGGEIIFQGDPTNLSIHTQTQSLTADYLTGQREISIPTQRRKPINSLTIEEATQHNLKAITATFPLEAITVVSGVSGSGKTTLVKKILYPALKRQLEKEGNAPGQHKLLSGDIDTIQKIELIDQNPLGRSSRSNPATYTKAYDVIRELYAQQGLSRIRGFKRKHFSFNVEGGRCENCKGDGMVTIEMQFLADIHLTCEECNGQRFKNEVLEVTYKDKSIFDVLKMSVDEALVFFKDVPDVANKIRPLADVGLGYVKLGQSSSTLSGGEAQRVKLASYLGKGKSRSSILFIFDEPTTGLHFHDIHKLLQAFNALVEQGHTVVIVEHNLDIIKCADWVIDLGPDGGKNGGHLLYQGTPEGLLSCEKSYTAQYLKEKMPNF